MNKHERHIETELVPGRRLGRRPADQTRPVLLLGDVLTGVIPDHPTTADHFSQITDWGLCRIKGVGGCW